MDNALKVGHLFEYLFSSVTLSFATGSVKLDSYHKETINHCKHKP